MKLSFDRQLAANYKSVSQRARVLTEDWVGNSVFCPNCGQSDIDKYPNGKPVADFYCSGCYEEYELKSKQSAFGAKMLDGAHRTMLERVASSNNPNFFLLNYDMVTSNVRNFLVIPKHFFVSDMIEKRKPLAPTARRAGYIGCNILLSHIPQAGKIYYVRNGQVESKQKVLREWKKTLFLRENKAASEKGWLLDIMQRIERLGKRKFRLEDVYAFEDELSRLHPDNRHIKEKIRQQLQVLRDKGYLDFVSRGHYRFV